MAIISDQGKSKTTMSLWYCAACKVAFGPHPHCPQCGKPGVWQR